jgi:putative ABC transport system permease protein
VSYWLETSFDLPRLDYRYLLVCVIALWLISQFSALFPARRAAAVPPAVATRTV